MEENIASSLRPELVAEAASLWNATGETDLLDEVTNYVYEFKSHKERRILRLTHSSHHSEDEIIAELDWVNFLVRHGIPASRPLLSKNRCLTERFEVEDSYFIAVVFEYAPGHFIDSSDPKEWNPQFFQTLGRTMGRMHHASKLYDTTHLRQKRSHWYDDDLLQNAADYLPSDQKQAAADMEMLLARLAQNTPTADCYGLVHCDVNPTNFHINNGQITLFDFDDCAYNWFVNDIAVTLPMYSKQFTEEGWETRMTEFFQWYMKGYNEENHLDEFWLDYLPDCLRLQNLITLIACYKANVPNSEYHSFYELVLKTYLQGHPLFTFDFRKAGKFSLE
jgi:Ser/Thr protein kinase RdoA (MazF antagonist)